MYPRIHPRLTVRAVDEFVRGREIDTIGNPRASKRGCKAALDPILADVVRGHRELQEAGRRSADQSRLAAEEEEAERNRQRGIEAAQAWSEWARQPIRSDAEVGCDKIREGIKDALLDLSALAGSAEPGSRITEHGHDASRG